MLLLILLLPLALLVAILQTYDERKHRRGNHGCIFFNEKTVLQIGVGVCVLPSSFLIYKLSSIQDVFGVKPEVACGLIGSLSAGGRTDLSHETLKCYAGEPSNRGWHYTLKSRIVYHLTKVQPRSIYHKISSVTRVVPFLPST